jgi:hypothetical protein
LTTKNYVNSALQLTSESDNELLLDFMLYLLCGGYLSCSEVPDANRRARRLMLKMITKTPVTPSSLFVKGINTKVIMIASVAEDLALFSRESSRELPSR